MTRPPDDRDLHEAPAHMRLDLHNGLSHTSTATTTYPYPPPNVCREIHRNLKATTILTIHRLLSTTIAMNPATSSQELDTLIQGFGENEEEDLLPLDLISLDRMRRPSQRARQIDAQIEQETPVMGLGLLGVEERHTLEPLPCDPVMSLTSTMATVTIESRGQVDWGAPFIPRVPHTLRADAAPASGSGKHRASKQRRHHRRLSRSHPYSPERPLPKPLLTNLPPIEGLLAGEDDLAAAPLSPLVLPATWPSPIGSCRAPARSGTASRSTSIARSRYSSSSPARSVLAHAPMVLPEEPCQASWAVPG